MLTLPGFDKWCRIKSGLSNAKIAQTVSTSEKRYTEEDVRCWRDGEGIPEPGLTLLPLRKALMAVWPPATAEDAWQELLAVIGAGVPWTGSTAERKAAPVLEPIRATPPRPKAAAPKTEPAVEACKAALKQTQEELAPAVHLADQIQAGWFTRTQEKFKKYSAARDLKHRKAYLEDCLKRADAFLEKARSRRSELATRLEGLGAALAGFDRLQKECTERMERQRDENVGLWRELKAAAGEVATARQAYEKANAKSLASLDDVLKRAENTRADWQTRHDAIEGEGAISLAWLTPQSKLGQRLQSASWSDDSDPFEGHCICKDKLADNYKVGGSHKQEKPVEIDLACEIDLTVVGLKRRQEAVRALG